MTRRNGWPRRKSVGPCAALNYKTVCYHSFATEAFVAREVIAAVLYSAHRGQRRHVLAGHWRRTSVRSRHRITHPPRGRLPVDPTGTKRQSDPHLDATAMDPEWRHGPGRAQGPVARLSAGQSLDDQPRIPPRVHGGADAVVR